MLEGAYFLHEKGVGEEAQLGYLKLATSLEELIGKTFNDWGAIVDRELHKQLEVPLMSKLPSRYIHVHTCIVLVRKLYVPF